MVGAYELGPLKNNEKFMRLKNQQINGLRILQQHPTEH